MKYIFRYLYFIEKIFDLYILYKIFEYYIFWLYLVDLLVYDIDFLNFFILFFL